MRAEPAVTDEELAQLRETARRFSIEELRPAYQTREDEGRFDRVLIRRMGELGLIGPELPARFGGLGLTNVASGIVVEQIAYGDFNVAYVLSSGSLIGQILAQHASDELASLWVPRIVEGDALVAIAVTEPDTGSDAARLSLKAVRKGDRYVLSGEKTSISIADQAEAFVVFARTGTKDEGARGISAFLVEADRPGLSRSRLADLGSKAVGRGSLFFDDLEIPSGNRLGPEGRGFVQVMNGFDFNRAFIGLMCIGAAQASLDETWRYAVDRQAFGAPISSYQGVTFPLADLEAQLHAARQLCLHTLSLRDAGAPTPPRLRCASCSRREPRSKQFASACSPMVTMAGRWTFPISSGCATSWVWRLATARRRS